jgi:hypothetical protein
MDNKEMKRQIIQLLESITSCEIKDFTVKYNEKIFESSYPLIPNVIKKGRESNFFLRSKAPMSNEEIQNQNIQVSYFDEEHNKMEKLEIKLSSDTIIADLNKYSVKIELDSLEK